MSDKGGVMPNDKIQLTDSVQDVITKLSQGNPWAITVCRELVKADNIMGFFDLLNMDDMGMRGPAIWIAYKDFAKQDIPTLQTAIRNRDAGMLDAIRKEGYRVVNGGASFQ